MNKKNKGFTTIELITSFTLASVIMIILFNIILILKDNLSKVNAKTNMLVNKDNLSYNINKRFKEKELSSVTMCEDGDKCYEFKYSDDTSDKLVYSNTDKSITFNNYTFDIIDGITVEEPTITEHYDTMSSTTYNGYFIINIPIKLDNKDYSIKINKHFNTDSLVVDLTEYLYDTNGNKYTQVEYLESTGTQYIDTGISISGIYNSSIIFELSGINNGFKRIVGGRSDWLVSAYLLVITSDNKFRVDMNKSSTFLNTTPYSNQIYNATWDNNTFCLNDECINYDNNYTSTAHYYLFYGHILNIEKFSEIAVMKLYSFQLRDNNNTLVRDYIPVIDSSERPCLFDKVSRECYYNQGTGEFLYG